MSIKTELAKQFGNILDPRTRSVTKTNESAFRPYDRYGDPVPGMHWLPLSLDEKTHLDLFLLRFDPGAQSMPHEHMAAEQFLVMEGTLTDCDGHVFEAGDFVRFEPGSKHHSVSESGCLLLAVLQEKNRKLEDG